MYFHLAELLVGWEKKKRKEKKTRYMREDMEKREKGEIFTVLGGGGNFGEKKSMRNFFWIIHTSGAT